MSADFSEIYEKRLAEELDWKNAEFKSFFNDGTDFNFFSCVS